MKRNLAATILFSLILVLAAACPGGGGDSGGEPSDSDSDIVDPGVWEALEDDPNVEVLISLRASDLPIGEWTPETMAEHADNVQASVLSVLTPEEFTLEVQFEITPAVYGLISQSGVEKLSTHPDVVHIARGDGGSVDLDVRD